MSNNNVEVEVLAPAPNGQLVINKGTKEILFKEEVIHTGVVNLYGPHAFLHSQVHSFRMLFRMRYWKENLMGVGGLWVILALIAPVVLGGLGSMLFNGVQVRAGLPGINATRTGNAGSSSNNLPYIEAGFWNRE